ncbi:MAG: macrocin O-methyltransferase [Gammaproteobacteria bacterium]|nr:MAG: macrocin O-methyltransferase [Gammaproteobacteria bacterium]
MQRCLLGLIYEDPAQDPWTGGKFDLNNRLLGRDWPLRAHSMIGKARMENLRGAIEYVLKENVPGDFIETGIWRGGACILMRAVLAAYGVTDRVVWCADSFEGLPEPNAALYPADAGDEHHTFAPLAVSLDEVQANFAHYGLLDERVRFLKGWFKDTLPGAPIARLAILRLDGDMYESTMDGLSALYAKVSPGGVVIVDDYGAVAACKQAVTDFRQAQQIDEPIRDIDGNERADASAPVRARAHPQHPSARVPAQRGICRTDQRVRGGVCDARCAGRYYDESAAAR